MTGRPTTMKSDPISRARAGVVTRTWSATSPSAKRMPGVTVRKPAPHVDHAGLERRADHAVEPRLARVAGVTYDRVVDRGADQQLALHALLARGGELRHGYEQGPSAVLARESLDRGAHHLDGAGGVDIAHVDVEPRQHGHRLLHGVGNVVELEVEENAVAPALDFAHDGRAFGVEKLHADLQKGFARFVAEQIEEAESLLGRLEVAGDDYVFVIHSEKICSSHSSGPAAGVALLMRAGSGRKASGLAKRSAETAAPAAFRTASQLPLCTIPMMSLRRSIPRRSISAGSASIIFLQA